MKTRLIKIKGDWQEVINDCRATVGKGELGHEPSESFKKKILIAEHSPIRDIIFKWKWENIESWIATHFVRHKWECFVKTQRTDRTGIDRRELPQSAEVDFTGEANVQALIDTARKRLCYMAAPETRKYMEDLKYTITEKEKEIGDVLVPNCVYRGFCPELSGCGFWEKFSKELTKEQLSSVERYRLYNEYIRRSDEQSNS